MGVIFFLGGCVCGPLMTATVYVYLFFIRKTSYLFDVELRDYLGVDRSLYSHHCLPNTV